MSRLPRLAAVLALVLSGCAHTAPAASTSPNPTFFGTWTGTASQYVSGVASGVPDSQWNVEVTIGPASRVSYPTLNCSGTLAFVLGAANVLTFRETITDGATRCAPSGLLLLTREGTALVYQWQDAASPSVAVGVLTRR